MDEEFYTQVAGHSFELAKVFALLVGSPPIPTPTGVFAIELTTPHGPSTGGGAQALQHITFVHGDLTIVVGSLDWVAGVIELRGFDHVAELYRRRWDKLLPIARPDFDQFATRLYHFSKTQDYAIVLKEHAPPREGGKSTTPPRSTKPTAPPPWVIAQQSTSPPPTVVVRSSSPTTPPVVTRTGSPTNPLSQARINPPTQPPAMARTVTSNQPPNVARTHTASQAPSNVSPSAARAAAHLARTGSPTAPPLAIPRTASRALAPNVVPSGTARESTPTNWVIVIVAIAVFVAVVGTFMFVLKS